MTNTNNSSGSSKKGLFSWFKKSKPETVEPPTAESPEADVVTHSETASETGEQPVSASDVDSATAEKPTKPGFFQRLQQGLSRTRAQFTDGLADLLLGEKAIDEDLLEELETQLLLADIGIEATKDIIAELTDEVSRKALKDSTALGLALKAKLKALLAEVEQPLEVTAEQSPFVILVVGVNGVGKTTTIGKLAKRFQQQGKSVMLAAGDTFRAAAVEQLQVWGERNQVPVVAQHTGADSASVIFDALESAKAKQVDVLIADTAGRLHTSGNLMEELAKVKRVMAKLDAAAPHEVLLVLDAGTGQNALNQAKQFNEAVSLTGLALTKLDGTAKGGVIFSIAKNLKVPVRFIGVGEGIDDLRPFDSSQFIDALFALEELAIEEKK